MKSYWVFASLIVSFQPAFGDVYHYVDERGRKVYVDRKSEIPQRYREQVQTIGSVEARTKPISIDLQSVEGQVDEAFNEGLAHQQIGELKSFMDSLVTPVLIQGNSVFVPVRLYYGNQMIRVNLLLDTGASRTVLHDDAIADLSIVKRSGSQARVAGGGVIDTRDVAFSRMEVGPYKPENTMLSVIHNHDAGSRFDGLLGMDFLRGIEFDVDFENSRIVWQKSDYDKAAGDIQQLEALIQRVQAARNDALNGSSKQR
ncbi:hypothetical protein CFI10_13740 [Marinobacterium iners]|jgi:predicted aspartyl protease|uniref:aspartyl protease family protein n=1 Tax=Marinobacterium TaxID=48075 RepID=UPI001A8C67C4|nr:aspartyl protease family protein [Marinobacterium iners]QSR36043.1 hypothetical protein CFI10_13740 [Marinobacterium iners]